MKTTIFKTLFLTISIYFIGLSNVQALYLTCPADQWVSCTDELWDLSNYPNATYNLNDCIVDAGDPVVEYYLNMCDVGTITRTWDIYINGQSASCTQTFYVEGGSFSYSDINWPLSGLIIEGCNPDTDPDNLPSGYGPPTYNNTTECTMIAVNYSDQLFTISSTCKKILRKWQIMNWCTYNENTGQGIYTFTQVIKLVDGGIPQIEGLDDVTKNSLNCSDAYVDVPLMSVDASPCGGAYTINNNSPYAEENGKDASGTYPIGMTKVKYTVHYACGKKAFFTVNIIVKDNKNPQPYCLAGLNLVLMGIDNDADGVNDEGMVEVWASDLDYGSFHTCPSHYPLQLSFSDDPKDNVRVFTCDEVGMNTVELWVTDKFGNQSYCQVELSIQNNGANITDCQPEEELTAVFASGYIQTPVGESIDDIEVEITKIMETSPTSEQELEGTDSIPYTAMKMTDRYGSYKFEELEMHVDYQLTCRKELNMHDFVTKEDVRALYRHIKGNEVIADPYLLIAADLDDNHNIDRADLYAMYDFAHGIKDDLGIEKTHVFISTLTPLKDIDSYYNNDYDSKIMLENVANNLSDQGFNLLVKGDLYSTKTNKSGLRADGEQEDQEILAYLEQSISHQINISPNPFNNELNISLATLPHTDIKVNLYSVNGKKLFESSYKPSKNISLKVDNDINTGIYYYQVIYNGQSNTGKLIKI